MMPNMDPRQLKNMMAKMGIKTSEIDASAVVIHCSDKDIVISSPQVTRIEAQGTVSFQIAGDVSENEKLVSVEITDEDVKTAMEQSGVDDPEKVRQALQDANGDIAEAIMKLKKDQ